ncbi:dynein axonemal light chain 4 isoform X3 [Stigmatopora nigra]
MAGTGEGKKEEADYKRLHSFPLIRSAAKMIKESMDKKFGSSWHVVIGEGFGFEFHQNGADGICRRSGPGRFPARAIKEAELAHVNSQGERI